MKTNATVLSHDNREEIFVDIIHELWKYSDEGLREIADEAGCHWVTLYQWKSGRTIAPRIDKLAPVARVLGYNVVLQKVKKPVVGHLRRVK